MKGIDDVLTCAMDEEDTLRVTFDPELDAADGSPELIWLDVINQGQHAHIALDLNSVVRLSQALSEYMQYRVKQAEEARAAGNH